MGNAVVVVRDKMQASYSYERSEPEGQNFDPDFAPELTPPEWPAPIGWPGSNLMHGGLGGHG